MMLHQHIINSAQLPLRVEESLTSVERLIVFLTSGAEISEDKTSGGSSNNIKYDVWLFVVVVRLAVLKIYHPSQQNGW